MMYKNKNLLQKIEKIKRNSSFKSADNVNKSRGANHGFAVKLGKSYGPNHNNDEKNDEAQDKNEWIKKQMQMILLKNQKMNKVELKKLLSAQWDRKLNKEVNNAG